MENLDRFKQTYFEECAELLGQAETWLSLLATERDADAGEKLNAVFRCVHSIKGGAGAFGFELLVRFAHAFESVLDALREGQLPWSGGIRELALRALDQLADLVGDAQTGAASDHDRATGLAIELAQCLAVPHTALDHAAGNATDPAPRLPVPPPGAPHDGSSPGTGAAVWTITFQPSADLLRKANEPLLLIRELKRLGTLATEVDRSAIPALDQLDVDTSYLGWVFTLETDADRATIEEVFEFVVDDSRLAITRAPQPEPAMAIATALPGIHGEAAGAPAGGHDPVVGGSIRVDLDKIDRLINMVGEIAIGQAALGAELARLDGDAARRLALPFDHLNQQIGALQESAMAIRAQPVKAVFQRIPRLVRELAGSLGKEVRLATIGEATEVDKTVIEQLADPLTHMVRNAVDHGIEAPADRVARGKPAAGTIVLSAEHRGGRIVIEVADDGGGIDRERVRRKCLERGLITADQPLDAEAIDNLIFAPGLSTAERVSDVSGRGVGMDVVRRNVQDLGGRVTVRSNPGHGARFILSLPLTLAVLDGMVLRVGVSRYVVPLTSIVESLRPAPAQIATLPGRGTVLHIRGDYIALVDLAEAFGIDGAEGDPTRGLVVIVEVEGCPRFGLVVDEILGQQQVVLKSLEVNYQPIEGIAAATILGDGQVALILDVGGLARLGGQPRSADQPLLRLAS